MRRTVFILVSLSILATGIFVVIWQYPFRFPPLQVESPPVPVVFEDSVDQIKLEAQGAFFQKQDDEVPVFRAFAPEPILKVYSKTGETKFRISNIHPAAVLQTNENGITEEIDNLSRHLTIIFSQQKTIELRWKFPLPDGYRFAAIGDSGENDELAWVVKRAHQLGAHFLLLLGDIYYDENYDRVNTVLESSPIPVYVALGNHDYLMLGGKPYEYFRRDLGPRNTEFSLGGVQFLNIDTAADTFPWFGGERGRLFREAPRLDRNGNPFKTVLVFTHRPIGLEDISSHVVNRTRESEWLKDQLLSRGVKLLLAGHIHESFVRDYDGIKIYVAGEGLGTRNLVGGNPMATILIGEVERGNITLSWQPLNMPLDIQCSLRNRLIWENEEHLFPFNREAMKAAREACLKKEK